MKRSLSIIFLFLLIINSVIFAQRKQILKQQTRTAKLDQLQEAYKIEAQQEKNTAQSVARQKGWPVRETLPDGTLIELQRLTPTGRPLYFITHNKDAARTVNTDHVWPGGIAGLDLTGAGMIIGEWDGDGVRISHQEFGNRAVQKDDASTLGNHSTHVAGTLIAAGVNADAKGMSYQATLHAYEWNNDNAEMASAAANGLLVSNHSYGYATGWEYNLFNDGRWVWFGEPSISETDDYNFGFYSEYTREWDEIAYNAPYYLIVKSAGNERNDDGPVAGAQHWIFDGADWVLSTATRNPDGDYDCMSHNSLAKNILSIGAINSLPNGYYSEDDVFVSSFSSWGPADDGRIKPDIVADGVALYSAFASSNTSYGYLSGTSMASPNAAGSVLLLQEHYQETHDGEQMLASTLKGLVIHSANEAGLAPGPDYMHGWGLLNIERAAEIVTRDGEDYQIIENILAQNNSYSVDFTLEESRPLVATICWTDPPGTPAVPALNPTDKMLMNDLDLRITGNGTTYYPYVLNPEQPHLPATTGDNNTDNVEKIYIAAAGPGAYTLTVNHKGTLTGGSQAYSLIISANSTEPSIPVSNIKWEERFSTTTPPEGWRTVDNDGSGSYWSFIQIMNFTDGSSLHPQSGMSLWFSNFNNANASGLIDEWVISPQINDIESGDSLYFYAGAVGGIYHDSLRVYISTTGNQLSDFTNRIAYFKVDGTVGNWHKYGFDLSQFDGENINIGVNYYIRQGGPKGIHSDNIWLDHFIITTDTTNIAPILSNPISDITLPEDFEPFTVGNLNDIFYDEDNPNLRYIISTDGNISAAEEESMLVLSPVPDYFGMSQVTIVASDGRKTVADTFGVTITPVNDAPVLQNVPDIYFLEDSEFMLPLNPFLSDVDHDSSQIQFLYKVLNVVAMSSARTMEAELTDLMVDIDSLMHIATFSASPDSNGEFIVEITAVDDSSAAGSDTITVTIEPVSDPPVVSRNIPDTTITEDNGPVVIINHLNNYFTDPDHEPLNYSAETDDNLIISIENNSVIITPQTDFFGNVPIRISASDDIETAVDTFTVVVRPVNDPPQLSGMPDVTFAEDSSATLPLLPFVQDIDTDSSRISFSAQVLTAQPFRQSDAVLIGTSDLIVTIDSLSRVATFTSSSDSAGQFSVQFTAIDDSGAADRDTIQVTITPVNDPPFLSAQLPDTSIYEDSGINVLISNLYDFFNDPDDPQLSFDALADTGLQLSVFGDSLLAAPDSNFFGKSRVRLTASDTLHTIADTFTVTILPVNDPPLLAGIPDITFSEDSSYTLPLNPYTTDIDNDSSQLHFSAQVLTAQIVRLTDALLIDISDLTITIDSLTHVAMFASSSDSAGIFEVAFTVSDTSNAIGTDTIQVTVQPVNDAPQLLAEIPDTTIFEDSGANLIIENIDQFFSDPDKQQLTFNINADSTLQFNMQNDSLFVTPAPDFYGQVMVKIAADDGIYTVADSFIITVLNVNDAPGSFALVGPTSLDTMKSILDRVEFNWRSSIDVDNIGLNYSLRIYNGLQDTLISDLSDSTVIFDGSRFFIYGREYHWTVQVSDGDLETASQDTFLLVIQYYVDIAETQPDIPAKYSLEQNYPNPFNPLTNIRFGLPKPGHVNIAIYNIHGQKIATVIDEHQEEGYHLISYDASHLASGIYFYKIEAGAFVQVRKMILMK